MNIKVAEKRLSINVCGNTCLVMEGECTNKDGMSQPLRVYYSLAGESQPELSSLPTDYTTAPSVHAYRYDWTFGITCIEGYDWKWLSKLQDNDPILIQLTISCNPENCFTISEFASFLLTLQPSRDTTPLYEKILTNLTKNGEAVGNLVKTLNDGIGNIVEKSMQLSNIIMSSQNDKKDWYVYKYYDNKENTYGIEWHINKNVIETYGPFIKGSVIFAYHGTPPDGTSGSIKLSLKPKLNFTKTEGLNYTRFSDDNHKVSIELIPQNQH